MVPSCVLLITSAAKSDVAGGRTVLQRPLLVRLGQWSFCIYMAHPMILALGAPWLRSEHLVSAVAASVVVILLVVLVAFVLYTTYERPAERLLRGHGGVRASTTGPRRGVELAQAAQARGTASRLKGTALLGRLRGVGPASG
jgi:peptidoglycan/LPS O-acetylase OafA/YrhL